MAFQFGPSGSLEDVSAVEFDGQSVDEIVLDGTSVWTSTPPLGASSSMTYPSGATDAYGNAQPHLVGDLSVVADTLQWPASVSKVHPYGGIGYTLAHGDGSDPETAHGFGSGGVAIEGDVCAVISPVHTYNTSYHLHGSGWLMIYERTAGSWNLVHTVTSFDSGDYSWGMGGYDSGIGTGLIVSNGRVFVTEGGSGGKVSIYSKDAGVWSREVRLFASSAYYINQYTNNGIEYWHGSNFSPRLAVHGGMLALGLPAAPGDETHYHPNWDSGERVGIVGVYRAPSSNQWYYGTRGEDMLFTDWLSPGAAGQQTDGSNAFRDFMEFGTGVAVRDGRVTGGPTVVAVGVNTPGDSSSPAGLPHKSHFYFIGDSNGLFTHRAGSTHNYSGSPYYTDLTAGIVEPTGEIILDSTYSHYSQYAAASLGGWGNDITMLTCQAFPSTGYSDTRMWQLNSGLTGFDHMQDIDNRSRYSTTGNYTGAEWGAAEMDYSNSEHEPWRRSFAFLVADRMIFAAGLNTSFPNSDYADRSILLREQSGQGGSSASIEQGDFLPSFAWRAAPTGLPVSPGSLGCVVANFEGYVDEQLASYWSANEASLLATYGSKRNWGEAHWYTNGIKEGRPMKYQHIACIIDPSKTTGELEVRIYEA